MSARQAEPWAKGQLPGWGWRHWEGPELDKGLWSHIEEYSFWLENKWKPVEVLTSGREKNLPSDLALFIEVIWFWACDPASSLQLSFSFFIQGGLESI